MLKKKLPKPNLHSNILKFVETYVPSAMVLFSSVGQSCLFRDRLDCFNLFIDVAYSLCEFLDPLKHNRINLIN